LREDLRVSRADAAAVRDELGLLTRRGAEFEAALHGCKRDLAAAATASATAAADRERERELERRRLEEADKEKARAGKDSMRLMAEMRGKHCAVVSVCWLD
jgi:hypothetical protein